MPQFTQIAFNFDEPHHAELSDLNKGNKIELNETLIFVDEINEPTIAVKKIKLDNIKTGRGRLPLKNMEIGSDLIEVPNDEELFSKLYYSMGKVAQMFKVNQSQIRFWENEFDILKPKKNAKGDRLFRPQDIKNLQLIYHLIREKKYTLEGAKAYFKKNKKTNETYNAIESLKKIRTFLIQLKANL